MKPSLIVQFISWIAVAGLAVLIIHTDRGNADRNEELVLRIDAGVRAIRCVLLIPQADRVEQNVQACIDRADAEFQKLLKAFRAEQPQPAPPPSSPPATRPSLRPSQAPTPARETPKPNPPASPPPPQPSPQPSPSPTCRVFNPILNRCEL